MRVPLCLSLLGLALAACSPTQIVLRNPASGEIAECRSGLPEPLLYLDSIEPCAKAFEQQGYHRVLL
jgi:hypothetical protein